MVKITLCFRPAIRRTRVLCLGFWHNFFAFRRQCRRRRNSIKTRGQRILFLRLGDIKRLWWIYRFKSIRRLRHKWCIVCVFGRLILINISWGVFFFLNYRYPAPTLYTVYTVCAIHVRGCDCCSGIESDEDRV